MGRNLARRLARVTGHPWAPARETARLGELVATPAGGERVVIHHRDELVYVGVPERTRPTGARMSRRVRDRAARRALVDELDLGNWLEAWRRRVERRRRLLPAIKASRRRRLARVERRRAPQLEFQLVIPGVQGVGLETCAACGVTYARRPGRPRVRRAPACPACRHAR